MDIANWIPAAVNTGLLLIWGGITHQRVRALESEVLALKSVRERLVRVETKLDALFEQLKDLNAAVRWMREPAKPNARVRPS